MRRPWLVLLTVLVAAAAGLAAVLFLPPFVVDHDLGRTTVGANERLTAVNNARTVLLQALRGATIAGTDLRGAEADADTRWPEDFDPATAGVVVR